MSDDIFNNFPIPSHDNIEETAKLLSLLCPDDLKHGTENGFGSAESFACLLFKESHLVTYVQKAYLSRNFDDVWDEFSRHDHWPVLRDKDNIFNFKETLPILMKIISRSLPDIVKGHFESPIWTLSPQRRLPMAKNLDIQSLMNHDPIPFFLFYDLGGFKDDPILKKRLDNIFCHGKNTFLLNATATGKTRLLYEGLMQHWGIYVTASVDHYEGAALQLTLSGRFLYDHLVNMPFKEDSLGYQSLLNGNVRLIERRFTMVLYVYLLVFKEFLKASHNEGVLEDKDLRCRWLLTQLWHPLLDKSRDVYLELVESLYVRSLSSIIEELNQVIAEINSLLPPVIKKEGLFIAIDEANAAIFQLWWSHHDQEHPPIKSIIRTWRDRLTQLDCPVTFIVAGTEIPSAFFPTSSPEWSSWRWTSDTGSFDDREVQQKYILPFLPPSYVETSSGKLLLERIWNWCRSRPRLTTVIIKMLMEDKMAHPHGAVDCYLYQLMYYLASDGANFVAEEGECQVIPRFGPVGHIVASSYLAQSATHEVVFHYIMTGQHPPYFGISRLEVVETGVGQFKDSDLKVIALDQPSPTIAAAIWMANYDLEPKDRDHRTSLRAFKDFSFFFNLPYPQDDFYSSTGYIAHYLAQAFVNGRSISEIFTVPESSWICDTSSLADLVVLRRNRDDIPVEMVVTPSALQPQSPPLGYRASNPEDVIAWFQQKQTGAFCLCPSDCWADLIFTLKLDGKYVWVFLRTIRQSQTEPEACDEFEYLTEHNLFARAMDADSVYQGRLSNIFEALPNSLAPSGSLPVLCVLASFPKEPVLPDNNSASVGPIGVLKVEAFKTISETFSNDFLIETLISSMHDKRLSYTDDMFSPLQPTSHRRPVQYSKVLMGASGLVVSLPAREEDFKGGLNFSDLLLRMRKQIAPVALSNQQVPDSSLSPQSQL